MQAAYDGRLKEISGFGEEKVKIIQVSLAGMFGTSAQRSRKHSSTQKYSSEKPDVGTLLCIDNEYRKKRRCERIKKDRP